MVLLALNSMKFSMKSSRVGGKWVREGDTVFAADLWRINVNVLKANN